MIKRNINLSLLFVLSFILILSFSACNDNDKKETTIEQDKKTTMETQKMDTPTHHLDTTVTARPIKPGN